MKRGNVMMKRLLPQGVVVSALAVAMVVTTMAVPAAAQPSSPSHRIERAMSKVGLQNSPEEALPTRKGAAKISADRPAVQVVADGASVGLALAADGDSVAAAEGDGRAFGDVARDMDALVRPVEGGAQILTVMYTAAAPGTHYYELSLPAGTSVKAVGAGFVLIDSAGLVVGAIEAPWAKDASGRYLPTSYTLNGSTLVQTTDTAGAAFPVVADPKLTYGFGVYLNMFGWEARAYAIAAIAVGGTALAVGCTAVGKIPNPLLRTLASLACGAGAVNLTKVWNAIITIYRSNALQNNSCYQMKIIPTGDKLVKVNGSNCT
ncbi:hypothetical protein KIF24_08215 [Micromonospora sp. Llam7]|uniref:hypothetical protein n=1 Tax=Micromonospora tarapacensis TaxID=2835305 RepID=UPI001C82AE64|nr:hypothetical protein [Micromonospora tarapacensis]MBX7266013.1 hypothetical protein [Micromonospora tarapacensis]